MIDSIDARLVHWSEAVKGNIGTGYIGSTLGRLVSGGSTVSHRGSTIQFDTVAYETEKAVQKLPDALKVIVVEFYINDSNTIEQKLKVLGISKRTLYRRLDMAHGLVRAYMESKF
jgi:hypothetical protein